jgi:hypothetical protein
MLSLVDALVKRAVSIGTPARIFVNYVYYSAHEQYIQNASLYPEAEFMNGVQSSLRFLGIILRVLRLEVSAWIS